MRKLRVLLAMMLAMLFVPRAWAAQYTKVDGIIYTVSGGDAYVYSVDASTDGILRFPETVTIDEETYNVVGFLSTAKTNDLNDDKWKELYFPKYFKNFTKSSSSNKFTTGLTNLEKVAFDEETVLDALPDNVFKGCTNLSSVELGKGVKYIGSASFAGCTSLQDIDLSGVVGFQSAAFSGCTSLSAINLSNAYTVGDYAFYGCTSLSAINLSNAYTVGDNAFYGCTNLATAEGISVRLQYIGTNAFRECPLTSWKFMNAGMQIGNYAFLDTQITQIDCTYTTDNRCVVPMNYTAFNNRSAITVTVPMGMRDAYAYTLGWKEMTIVDNAIRVNVTLSGVSDNPVWVKPSTLPETPVSAKEKGIIAEKGMVYGIHIPKENFTSLKMDDVEIKDCAPYYSYTYTENEVTYDVYYFMAASQDEVSFTINYDASYITFADKTTELFCLNWWDANHDGKLSTSEAAAVTSLDGALRGRSIVSFDELRYFTGLTSLGNEFWSCGSLERVTLPEGLTTIGENCFRQCGKLAYIHLPESLSRIEDNAFEGCSSLKTLYIPSGVEFVAETAFTNCPSLISVSVDEANETYDSRGGCNAVITSRDGGQILWLGCKNTLIPETATRIGYNAFLGCTGLESVELHSGIYAIFPSAFQGCSNLRRVTSYIETPFSIESSTFQGISDNCVLIVPVGTRDAYLAAGWTEDVFKGGVMEKASDDELSTYTYTGTEAGGLYTQLSAYTDDQLKAINRLTVNSPINSADLYMIRKLCGDYNNDPTGYADYGLELLDLTNATIVADYGTGTVPYMSSSYIRTDDELPEGMFLQCRNLVELRLPSSAALANSAHILQYAKSDMKVHAPWAEAPELTIMPLGTNFCIPFGMEGSADVAGMTLIVPKGSLASYQAAEGWNWFKEIREESDEDSGSGSGSDTQKGDIDGDGEVTLKDVTKLVNMILKK